VVAVREQEQRGVISDQWVGRSKSVSGSIA
jgi:hypothetical protein